MYKDVAFNFLIMSFIKVLKNNIILCQGQTNIFHRVSGLLRKEKVRDIYCNMY